MKFIKLHNLNDEEFYINFSHIVLMERYSKEITYLHVGIDDSIIYTCKETPEEILRII